MPLPLAKAGPAKMGKPKMVGKKMPPAKGKPKSKKK